jgi:hypothetical protein
MRLPLFEQVPKILSVEIGIAQNASEGAEAEFPVQRDDERVCARPSSSERDYRVAGRLPSPPYAAP